jgi:hypothetical protein
METFSPLAGRPPETAFNFLPGTTGRTIGRANSGIIIGTEVGSTFDSRTVIIFGNILCNITMGITRVDITHRFLCNSLLTVKRIVSYRFDFTSVIKLPSPNINIAIAYVDQVYKTKFNCFFT